MYLLSRAYVVEIYNVNHIVEKIVYENEI